MASSTTEEPTDLFEVKRSSIRQLTLLLGGAVLIFTAVDVIWLHWLSGPPQVNEETLELTTRGLSQQRTDYLWGTFFVVAGVITALVAIGGLLTRRPVVEMDDEQIRLRVNGPRGFVRIPWKDVRWVHSSSDGDDERIPTRVLLVNVDDPSRYPQDLWGAQWDDRTLMVDADSWRTPPDEAVTHATRALAAWRREHPVATEYGDNSQQQPVEGDTPEQEQAEQEQTL